MKTTTRLNKQNSSQRETGVFESENESMAEEATQSK